MARSVNTKTMNNARLTDQSFTIEGRVALITGAASGIGLSLAKNLLEHEVRGLTIVDMDRNSGEIACKELRNKYGYKKVIFVKADIYKKDEFEVAFKDTVSTFGAIDILINNAGIYNDQLWQREIDVNITGTVNGIMLGMEHYIPKYKSGAHGVIVNVGSISATGGHMPFPLPIYTATKFAVHGLTMTFGCPEHFQRTGVRVVAICPGITQVDGINISTEYFDSISLNKTSSELIKKFLETHSIQSPDSCAIAATLIIEKAPSGTLWICEDGQKAYQYTLPNRFGIPKIYLE